jgi:two-component system NarL family response regulator
MGDPTATDGVRIRVLTADDHPIVRAGIAAMIANEPDIDIVAEGRDGAEAVALFEAHRPDVVLMDLRMPRVDGVAAILAIRAIEPNARVIALTTYDGDADIHRALSAGAGAYLIKDTMVEQLVAAIRLAASGKRVIPPDVATRLAEFTPRADLSAREQEVLRHVANGLGNKEIAQALGRSADTVKAHLESIFEKLGARDRTHAVTIALQRGIIHLDE